jgi:hypothetical protein
MSATDDALAKATDGLGDDLKPIDPNAVEKPKEEAPEDPAKQEPETPEEGKNPKEDGFTANELDEPAVEEPEEPVKPVEPSPINTEGMDPETKYIVDNLPFMTARIKDGKGIKEVQVKSWTQLPEDVEFASKRDELAFTNALTAQENRALSLQAKFQQDQQTTQSQEFEEKINTMIREDVAELQKEGEIPKFKTKMDDPDFDKDPATQEVQKVLDYMEERNKQYLAEYQQGRPFKQLGFREAFYLYQRTEAPKNAQRQEDQERKELAERLTGNRGLASAEMKKPTVRPGTRIEDILNRIDQEW